MDVWCNEWKIDDDGWLMVIVECYYGWVIGDNGWFGGWINDWILDRWLMIMIVHDVTVMDEWLMVIIEFYDWWGFINNDHW